MLISMKQSHFYSGVDRSGNLEAHLLYCPQTHEK